MQRLTPPQQRVLDFIRAQIASRGFPPTHREICDGMGFASTNAAAQHVQALIRKGRLSQEKGKARSLRLAESTSGARA